MAHFLTLFLQAEYSLIIVDCYDYFTHIVKWSELLVIKNKVNHWKYLSRFARNESWLIPLVFVPKRRREKYLKFALTNFRGKWNTFNFFFVFSNLTSNPRNSLDGSFIIYLFFGYISSNIQMRLAINVTCNK